MNGLRHNCAIKASLSVFYWNDSPLIIPLRNPLKPSNVMLRMKKRRRGWAMSRMCTWSVIKFINEVLKQLITMTPTVKMTVESVMMIT